MNALRENDGDPVRIAMWSGPRNISTAMMRAFENRPDCVVVDEPFYAAFLRLSGRNHPMREEIIADGEVDWRKVVDSLFAPLPGSRVFYQKQMTHHMLPGQDRSWIPRLTNVFLIRSPERVAASYAKKRDTISLEDLGFQEQVEIFDQVADALGKAPPVVDADDILATPRRMLQLLCEACQIPFDEAMLAWPAGRRASDGIWARHWYGAVEASTGFEPPPAGQPILSDALKRIVDQARPFYDRMAIYRMKPE
ncbi:hypothetical protein [Rhodoligotrophos ferricapiens]|uniref:sulfotransferase-like domain-containing protein n=1 Tax=Rhodoligotrophos ferricapiens TaxID=3069264 RepID=UPI00315D2A6D